MRFMIAFVTALYHLGTLITLGSLVRKLSMLHCLQYYNCGVYHGLGKTETPTEVLRSILAQLEYSYLVRDYSDRQGVPFNQHLYVPETHPVSNAPFCEREDEAHVLKVCDMIMRFYMDVLIEHCASAANCSQHAFRGASYNPLSTICGGTL